MFPNHSFLNFLDAAARMKKATIHRMFWPKLADDNERKLSGGHERCRGMKGEQKVERKKGRERKEGEERS